MGTDHSAHRDRRGDRKGNGDRGKKEKTRGKGERRSRSRDRRRQKETETEAAADRSLSRRAVLRPAEEPEPAAAVPVAAGSKPSEVVPLDDDTSESSEEETPVDDPTVKPPPPPRRAETRQARPPEPSRPPAKADKGGTGGDLRIVKCHRGDGKSDPTTTAGKPENHDKQPDSQADTQSSQPIDKHSKFDCNICGRKVGGGTAGSWQHRRSPYHLASWVYWNNKQTLPWKKCLEEGARWSKLLWDTNQSGPEDDTLPNKPTQKRATPAPVRSDPERLRRDKDDKGDPDPDTGAGSSGSNNLLLQLWQTTLKELR